MARAPRQVKPGLFGQVRAPGVTPGAGAVGRALASVIAQVGQVAGQVAQQQAEEVGFAEGLIAGQARDEAGNLIGPELKSSLTLRGRAFNQAAKRAFMAQSGNDFAQQIDIIRNETRFDPEAFKTRSSARLKEYVGSMPEEVREEFKLVSSGLINKNQIAVNAEAQVLAQQEVKAGLTTGFEALRRESMKAARAGDGLAAEGLRLQSLRFLDEALFSPTEIKKAADSFAIELTQQDIIGQAERAYVSDGALEALNTLERLDQKEFKLLSPQEKGIAMRLAEAEVNQRVTLDDRQERLGDEATKLAIAETEYDLTIRAVNGDLKLEELTKLAQERQISMPGFIRLENEINALNSSRATGAQKDNFAVREEIFSEIMGFGDPGEVRTQIINEREKGNLTPATADRLLKQNIDRGQFVPNYKSRRQQVEKSLSVKGILGNISPDEARRIQDALITYDERTLVGGEDPVLVAEEVIARFSAEPISTDALPNLMFGVTDRGSVTLESLKLSKEGLVKAINDKTIDKAAATREAAIIEQYQDILLRERSNAGK